jgi:hypothetical protein
VGRVRGDATHAGAPPGGHGTLGVTIDVNAGRGAPEDPRMTLTAYLAVNAGRTAVKPPLPALTRGAPGDRVTVGATIYVNAGSGVPDRGRV